MLKPCRLNLNLLLPDVYLENICSIDIEKLKTRKNIKGIIIDLDNTLIPYGQKTLDDKVKDWIEQVKQSGLKIHIVSNSHIRKVSNIGNLLEIPYFYNCFKPFQKYILLAMEEMNTGYEETAIIGDQILTDVLGGNFARLLTILVHPLSSTDSIFTTLFNRTLERLIFSFWSKNGKIEQTKGKWPQ